MALAIGWPTACASKGRAAAGRSKHSSSNSKATRSSCCSTELSAARDAGLGREAILAIAEDAAPLRQQLTAGLRHQHRVLELSRKRAISGHHGPVVVQHFAGVVADVDHRLDGEDHPRF